MGNKTISLDDICEGILDEFKKRDHLFSFSAWIRSKMLEEYNTNHPTLTKVIRHGVPTTQYQCPNCKVNGHHWEEHCPFPTKEEQMMKIRARAARGEEE